MRRRGPLALIALIAVPLAACGGGGTSTATQAASGCRDVPQPAPKHVRLKRPKQTVSRAAHLRAVVATTCGSFTIALDARRAPRTVNSFAYLARRGFYDDTTFHRVVPGFVIQGGDPLGNGTGGPGYFVDEPPPQSLSYTRGTVAMAKAQVEPPGRSGSQFFVVLPADAGLPPDYALLGRVTRGWATVRRIAALGVPGSASGRPSQPVVIRHVAIRRGG